MNGQGENPNNGAVPPAADDVTKIVSKRLNEEREKLAKAIGFDSWDSAMNSGLDKKLLDAGIEPTTAKPVIESIVNSHPKVLEAEALLAKEREKREQAELGLLNAKYGVTINSYNDLDSDTKKLVDNGVPIEKAYLAIHMDELQGKTATNKAATVATNSLNHMTSIPGAAVAPASDAINVSPQEVASVRQYLPNASEEDIKNFLKAHPQLRK